MSQKLPTSWSASLAWPGAPLAIVSAVLFGASTPLAKLLLGSGVSPWLLAGILYLGSGIGLSVMHLLRGVTGIGPVEASLKRSDLPWLGLVVLTGGAIGARAAGKPLDTRPWGAHATTADHNAVPQAFFTDPEAGAVGLTAQ